MELSSGAAYVQPAAYPHTAPLRLKSDIYAGFSIAGDDGVCVIVCWGSKHYLLECVWVWSLRRMNGLVSI